MTTEKYDGLTAGTIAGFFTHWLRSGDIDTGSRRVSLRCSSGQGRRRPHRGCRRSCWSRVSHRREGVNLRSDPCPVSGMEPPRNNSCRIGSSPPSGAGPCC